MSQQPDFFATAPVAQSPVAQSPVAQSPVAQAPVAVTPAPAPGPRDTSLRWWLAAVAAALVAAAVFGVVQWRADAKPAAPDLSTAREFGRQAGLELPSPVTEDDCAAAVRALPGIARDPGRRAAFIDACVHAR